MPSKKVLITAALPYANGPLHFGHIAGAYLPADCYARFRRLIGDEVLFVCGSDEYGIAITLNAEQSNMSYQDYVDYFHNQHKEAFQKIGMSLDFFSRTTNNFHKDIVREFYHDLLRNGYIEKKVTKQLFSEKDQKFLADRYVVGSCPKCGYEYARGDECQKCGASYEAPDLISPKSKLSNDPLILRDSEHSFLRLDLFKDQLNSFLNERYIPAHIRNFILDYIENIRPRAITRDLSWGVSVPNEENKVFYVWFDAPIGYISATMDWAANKVGDPLAWQKYWLDESTEYIQFIGKDNAPFHAIIFPAMQLGQDKNYKTMDALVVSEFYLLEGSRFSKSDGNYIDMLDFLNQYHVEAVRYVLAATAPETSDSEFSIHDFKNRCNTDLVGKLGNLVNRSVAFAKKNKIDSLSISGFSLTEEDKEFLSNIKKIADQIQSYYAKYSLRRATTSIMELASLGNVYFNNQAPWKVLKTGDRDSVNRILFCTCFCQKVLALVMNPIMPETSHKILKMINPSSFDVSSLKDLLWSEDFFAYETEQFVLSDPVLLFQVIE